MIEGIIVSVLVAYGAAWVFLKCFYWYDGREAKKISERMHRKQLIRYGRIRSDEEILQDARADTLHGWD